MKIYLAFIALHTVSTELGYSAVRESLEWRSCDGAGIRHSGPLNPLRGFLFSSIGALHNMRFFSPGISPCYTVAFSDGRPSYRRHYNRDTALHNDAFHRALLALFPSSAGRVSIATTRCGSFCYELSKSKERRQAAVRLLAALAAMSLGTDIRWSSKTAGKRHSVAVHVSPPIVMQGSSLDEVASVVEFFATPERDKEYLRSKMFLLQGFVHHFLDTRDELEAFFGHVYELAGRSEAFTEPGETESADYTLLDRVVEADRAFPFSPVRPMPANMSVPVYSRTTDTFGNTHFSDCGEATLLGLVCCLLYDTAEMRYSTGHLGECRLKEFFARHGEVFAVTMDIRRDWLRVVEDIYDEDVVYVKRDVRNEIRSGFINMLLILKKISNIDCDLELRALRKRERPSDYTIIRETFEKVFTETISSVSTRDIWCEFRNMKTERTPDSGTWDVFGEIRITIPTKTGAAVTIELVTYLGHAEVGITAYPFALSLEDRKLILSSAEAYKELDLNAGYLIERYARLAIGDSLRERMLYNVVARAMKSGNVHDIFAHGIIDTHNTKGALLDALFPHAVEGNDNANRITHNVVSSAELSDPATRQKYSGFVLLNTELKRLAHAAGYVTKPEYKHKILEWAATERHPNVACYCIQIDYSVEDVTDFYSLLCLLVSYDRMHCIEKLVRIRRRESCMLVQGIDVGLRSASREYTDYFFGNLRKEDLLRCEHHVYTLVRAAKYLEQSANSEETSVEDLEKIYCCFFCARDLSENTLELFGVVSGALIDSRADTVYNVIVRMCPKFHKIPKFYKHLLEFAVRNNIRVRNDVHVLMKQIAQTLTSYAKYTVLGVDMEDYLYGASDELQQEMLELVDVLEKRNLVDKKIVFDEDRYIMFIGEYTSSEETVLQEYVSEIEGIFEKRATACHM